MIILGISAFYHDSACALIKDGDIVAAVQEERFTRIKHDPGFPSESIKYILDSENLNIDQIDAVVFYEKPFVKFTRLLETYVALAPKGFLSFSKAIPVWLKEKLFLKNLIFKELKKFSKNFSAEKIKFSEHHFSHASSAFYPSPFKKAVVLTLDGVGEWATSSVAIGEGNRLEIVKEINFPHSLGLLYSAFTYYCGFKVNSGEYKLMGLAPYGSPIYSTKILENIIDLKEDGSFRLNQKFFNYSGGLTMTNKKFANLFGRSNRNPEDQLSQFYMDIAASIQKVLEEVLLRLVGSLAKEHSVENLCLAGGVALNCVANGKILDSGKFKKIWIQPASGDAGGAVGAALAYYHHELQFDRVIKKNDSMNGSYLGPEYSDTEIERVLVKKGFVFEKLSYSIMLEKTAKCLASNKAVGWFQGKMEFGPRALGNRSILADPRSKDMQYSLNMKTKFRESFRPFAPSIMREKLHEWFDLNQDSPYMLIVSSVSKKVKKKITKKMESLKGLEKLKVVRSCLPSVTHVDYSARIQTVRRESNKRYYDLLNEFNKITGCPVLINTSFNVRGEPIVCKPDDALKCFMGTNLDVLVLNNFFLEKSKQTLNAVSYEDKFDLD